jgi:hypothetical protein
VVRKGEVGWSGSGDRDFLDTAGMDEIRTEIRSEKTLELLFLRRQSAIVERTLDKSLRPSRGEKLTLVCGGIYAIRLDFRYSSRNDTVGELSSDGLREKRGRMVQKLIFGEMGGQAASR